MKNFKTIQKVEITERQWEKAENFARKVIETVNYTDSRQTNKNKIMWDHFVSKIGEEAVKTVFEKMGLQVKGPDYAVYEGRNKNWDDDLFIDDVPLAVKTQTANSARKFGLSWTFQCGARRSDPILKKLLSWVCFVAFDEAEKCCSVYPPLQIKDLPLKDPVLKKLIGEKKVVYAADLKIL